MSPSPPTPTPSSPSVSVVMPVRNPDPVFFPAAVAAVLDQSHTDFELLVVEDAGPRGDEPPAARSTAPAVADLLDAFDDARIHHVVHDQPGIASTRNRGLDAARASLIAMADADDLCAPDRLAMQAERFGSDPDLAVLGTQLTVIDAAGRVRGARRYPTEHDAILAAFPLYNPVAQPGVMFRRSIVEAVGGYRDGTCEDYDLWSRVARAGGRFATLDVPLLSYRMHDAAMKRRKLRASLRDTIRIKREHWAGQLGVRGRLRILGERGLMLLPAGVVLGLFRWVSLRG